MERMPTGIVNEENQRQVKLSVIHPPRDWSLMAGAVTNRHPINGRRPCRVWRGEMYPPRMACSPGLQAASAPRLAIPGKIISVGKDSAPIRRENEPDRKQRNATHIENSSAP